ncbi:Uncharacterised protein [Mycobacteroides abscessus subsp. abscessus]|nr:Uncharacterised protein [Mycobacteroides abscessus subsp. abscessus]
MASRTHVLAASGSIPSGLSTGTSGRAHHRAYCHARASAAAARSGDEYDGIEPRAGSPDGPGLIRPGGMPSTARKVVTIGLSASASGVFAPAIRARACQSRSTATGGTKTTITLSTPGSAMACATEASNSSSEAPAPRSMVDSTSRPPDRAVSAARLPSTEELPMMRVRGPRGSG